MLRILPFLEYILNINFLASRRDYLVYLFSININGYKCFTRGFHMQRIPSYFSPIHLVSILDFERRAGGKSKVEEEKRRREQEIDFEKNIPVVEII